MNNCSDLIQSSLYPHTCFICDQAGSDSLDLCLNCLQDLKINKHSCVICDIELTTDNSTCGKCLKTTPHFDQVSTLYRYEGIAQFLIQSLKFQTKHCCAKIMGTLMAEHFKHLDEKPDAIMAVPLHTQRIIERGFNQSEQIAQHLHKQLGIPTFQNSLTRTINTASQASLNAIERRKNIKGAFRYKALKDIESVAIVDDVVTTGSTANEIAKTLKKAGVKRVEIWAFSRA